MNKESSILLDLAKNTTDKVFGSLIKKYGPMKTIGIVLGVVVKNGHDFINSVYNRFSDKIENSDSELNYYIISELHDNMKILKENLNSNRDINSELNNIKYNLERHKKEKLDNIKHSLNNILSNFDEMTIFKIEEWIKQANKREINNLELDGKLKLIKPYLKYLDKDEFIDMIDNDLIEKYRSSNKHYINKMKKIGDPNRYNVNSEILKHAYLSNIIYEKDVLHEDVQKELKRESGLNVIDHYGIAEESESGLSFVTLVDDNENPLIVIRGTGNGGHGINDLIGDIKEDIYIGFNKLPFRQLNILANYIQNMIDEDKISETKQLKLAGHSLGGALAQALTAIFKDYIDITYTYNSPGVKNLKADIREYDGKYFYNKITPLGKENINKNLFTHLYKFNKNRDNEELDNKVINIGLIEDIGKPDAIFNKGEHIGSVKTINTSIVEKVGLDTLGDRHSIANIVENLATINNLHNLDNELSENEMISIFNNNSRDYILNTLENYNSLDLEKDKRYTIDLDYISRIYNIDKKDIINSNQDIFGYGFHIKNDIYYIYYTEENFNINIGDKNITLKEIDEISRYESINPEIFLKQYRYIKNRENDIDKLNRMYNKKDKKIEKEEIYPSI